MYKIRFGVLAGLLASMFACSLCSHGTTTLIENLFQSRCCAYNSDREKILPSVHPDCKTLWSKFYNAWAGKDPCSIEIKDYKSFFTHAEQGIPKNRSVFWSGLSGLAHEYVKVNDLVTLEDTIAGKLMDGLNWCGQTGMPRINFRSCPSYYDKKCTHHVTTSFWAGASTHFATKASGNITVLLYASDSSRKAYRPDSFFAKYEVPNLSTKVTSVDIIVVHQESKRASDKENCSKGSILDLKKALKERHLKYSCHDNPKSVTSLKCIEDPTNRKCA